MAGDYNYKYVAAARLREIIRDLPDEWEVSARSHANTGNLVLAKDGIYLGFIDLIEETVNVLDSQ